MMSDTIVTVNTMLVDVKGDVDEALMAVSTTAGDAQVLMKDMGERGPHDHWPRRRRSAPTSRRSSATSGRAAARIGKLLTDDALFEQRQVDGR